MLAEEPSWVVAHTHTQRERERERETHTHTHTGPQVNECVYLSSTSS